LTDVSLRAADPTDPTDAVFVDALLLADAMDLLVLLPDPTRSDLAGMQVRARREGYRRDWPGATEWVITRQARAVGRILVAEAADHVHVVDLRVAAEHRGQGIGAAALAQLCADADQRGVALTLTVAADNPARRLYARAGFVQDPEAAPRTDDGSEQDADLQLRREPGGL
jgi:ribosomal protein S18 acetylase RimI-like enzyme